MIVIWKHFVLVWTNFENLIKNFKNLYKKILIKFLTNLTTSWKLAYYWFSLLTEARTLCYALQILQYSGRGERYFGFSLKPLLLIVNVIKKCISYFVLLHFAPPVLIVRLRLWCTQKMFGQKRTDLS